MRKRKLTREEALQAKRAAVAKSAMPLEVYFDPHEQQMIEGAAKIVGVGWEAYVYNTVINSAGHILDSETRK